MSKTPIEGGTQAAAALVRQLFNDERARADALRREVDRLTESVADLKADNARLEEALTEAVAREEAETNKADTADIKDDKDSDRESKSGPPHVPRFKSFKLPRCARAMAAAKDGSFAMGAGDEILIFSRSGELLETMETGHREVYDLALLGEDERLISCGSDGSVKIWRGSTCEDTMIGHSMEAVSLAILSDGKTIASGGSDASIRYFRDGRCVGVATGHESWVYRLVALEDGKLASAGYDSFIMLWDHTTRLQILRGHGMSIYALARLADGRLVSGGLDKILRVWKDGVCETSIADAEEHICDVSVMPDGCTVLVSSGDKKVRLYRQDDPDSSEWSCFFTADPSKHIVNVCRPLADGRIVASANEGTVLLW